MKRLIILLLGSILFAGTSLWAQGKFVLVIDAGHGGRDSGANRGTILEKDIALTVALELGKLIEKNMPDVDVQYTRKKDVFVELDERANFANKHKANLFISLHVNSLSAKTTTVAGTETFILGLARSAENLAVAKRENAVIKYEEDYKRKYEGFDPDSPESYIIFEFMTNQYMQQSLDIASYIQSEFKAAKRVDRGVKQGGLLVLRESAMPSILVEMGFINNPTEAKYLTSPNGQKTLASSIYAGFKKYKEDFDRRGGHSPSQQTAPNTKPSATKPLITSPAASQSAGELEYRVQFLYSSHKLPANSSQFRGIVPTGYSEEGGYKYTVGGTTDYNEVLKLQETVRKIFSDAFVVRMPTSATTPIEGGRAATPSPTPAPQPQRPTQTQTLINAQAEHVPASSSKAPAGAIEYRVQFLYSPSKLADNSSQFKGMTGYSFYIDNGYKYTLGATTDYNEIRRIFAEVRKKFEDAFIIRMKDGKRQ